MSDEHNFGFLTKQQNKIEIYYLSSNFIIFVAWLHNNSKLSEIFLQLYNMIKKNSKQYQSIVDRIFDQVLKYFFCPKDVEENLKKRSQ